jgi:hypothetical protein
MKNYLRVALFLFVAALMGLTAACGTLDDEVDEGLPTPTPPVGAPTPAVDLGSNTPIIGTIGQPVALKAYSVILDDVKANPDTDRLEANMRVDNSKGEDSTKIPARAFKAIAPDESTLTPILNAECGVQSNIEKGEIAKGLVCWRLNGITDVKGYRVVFDAGRSAGRPIAWFVP